MDSIKTNDIHNAEAEIPHLFQAQCASSKPGSYIAMQQLLSDTTGGNLSDDHMQLPRVVVVVVAVLPLLCKHTLMCTTRAGSCSL